MDTIQAVLMGFVQGLSEFLPISSSAHIVFTSAIYKIVTGQSLELSQNGEEVFFDIVVHLGTLFAILIFFKKDIMDIIKGFFTGLVKKDFRDQNFLYGSYIIIATGFTGVLALLFEGLAHKLIENPMIVALLLIITGFILFFSNQYKQNEAKINLKNAILIGVAQGLAVFPGLSRSGLTISTGVFKGINRIDAAKFSFLLSAPIILLASFAYPLIKLDFDDIQTFNFTAIFWGFLVSFISGYFCIKYFMRFLEKSNLRSFAYYCWIVGGLMFGLFAIFRHL